MYSPLPENYMLVVPPIEDTQFTNAIGDRKTMIFEISGLRTGNEIFSKELSQDLVNYDLDVNGNCYFPNCKDLHIKSDQKEDKMDVELFYLDEEFEMQKETLKVNGDKKTKINLKIQRIMWMHLIDSKTPKGRISIECKDNIYETINPNSYNSKSGRFTVPKGYTAFLIDWKPMPIQNNHFISIVANVSKLERVLLNEGCYIEHDTWNGLAGSNYQLNLNYMKFPEKSDIKIKTICNDDSGSVAVQLSILLMKNQNDESLMDKFKNI